MIATVGNLRLLFGPRSAFVNVPCMIERIGILHFLNTGFYLNSRSSLLILFLKYST